MDVHEFLGLGVGFGLAILGWLSKSEDLKSRKSGATSNDLVDELRFVERPVGKLGRDMSTGAALQYSRV